MHGTAMRAFEARERPDEPNGNNRCACGRTVDGYDARLGEATCEKCARLRTDGSDLQADAEHYLEAAGDQLETAAAKAESDWLRNAIESLRVDLAKLQGFRTAAEIRDDRADDVDRGAGIETDGGRDSPKGDIRVTLDRDDVQSLMKDGTAVIQKEVGPITVNIRTHQQLNAIVTVSGRRKDPDPEVVGDE